MLIEEAARHLEALDQLQRILVQPQPLRRFGRLHPLEQVLRLLRAQVNERYDLRRNHRFECPRLQVSKVVEARAQVLARLGHLGRHRRLGLLQRVVRGAR